MVDLASALLSRINAAADDNLSVLFIIDDNIIPVVLERILSFLFINSLISTPLSVLAPRQIYEIIIGRIRLKL